MQYLPLFSLLCAIAAPVSFAADAKSAPYALNCMASGFTDPNDERGTRGGIVVENHWTYLVHMRSADNPSLPGYKISAAVTNAEARELTVNVETESAGAKTVFNFRTTMDQGIDFTSLGFDGVNERPTDVYFVRCTPAQARK
jgi:hypothetical protein